MASCERGPMPLRPCSQHAPTTQVSHLDQRTTPESGWDTCDTGPQAWDIYSIAMTNERSDHDDTNFPVSLLRLQAATRGMTEPGVQLTLH
eukprot:2278094-Amphidinium_carterae.1